MNRFSFLWVLLIVLAAAAMGAGVAYGELYFAAFAVAAILAIPLLLMPLEQLMWGGWALTFLVAGQLQYFGNFSKAFWLPYLFGALLFMRLPLDLMATHKLVPRGHTENPSKKWALLFFATAAFSTAINMSPPLQVLVSLKEYVFVWSILVVLALGLVSSQYLERTWLAMLWLVPVHIPVILYQRFVVAAGRSDHAGFDAVVGLFGGDQEHAGATGGMGLFLLFTLLLSLSLWRAGKLRTLSAFAIGIMVMGSVLLAEVKFVILLLPLGIALLYRRELLRRPVRAFMMMALSLVLAAGLSTVYQTQFGNKYNAHEGPFGYLQRAIEKNSDSDFYNPQTGEIGRVASLKYWWSQHGMDDPVHFLLGHGIGSARYGSVMGKQALKNPYYRIDRSTAAVYLWETGLLGLSLFLGFLLAAARLAARLSQDSRLDDHERALLAAIAPMLLLEPVVLFYNTDLNAVPQMQFLLMLMAGQVLFSSRRARGLLLTAAATNSNRTLKPFRKALSQA